MKKSLLFLFSAMLLISATPASAGTFQAGEEVRFGRSSIMDNLYTAGGSVDVSTAIEGDAYIAGGQVTMTGTVRDDLVIAGGDVNVLGSIGGDLRAAGANILIGETVGGEIVAAGGLVNVSSKTTSAKGTTIGAGLITIDGILNGTSTLAGGTVIINGTINGNLVVQADEELRFGNDAVVNGAVFYKGMKEASVAEGASITGGIQWEKQDPKADKKDQLFASKNAIGGLLVGLWFLKVLILLIAAFVFAWLFPKCTKETVQNTHTTFWMNLLMGLAIFFLMPISALILVVLLLPSIIGFAAGIAYLLLLLIAKVYAAIFVGYLILQLLSKGKDIRLDWKAILLGVLVFEVVALIPILGWLASAIVFLATLGATGAYAYRHIRNMQK